LTLFSKQKLAHTILIVDDEEMVRDMTKELLSFLGYNVIQAASGNEALDIVSRESSNLDLVLVDLIMPKMNGVTCFKKIREFNTKIPVIISSGLSGVDKKADMLEMGAAAYLEKPFTLNGLESTLNSISL